MRTLHCFVAVWTIATGLYCVCLDSAYRRKALRPPPEIVRPDPETLPAPNGRVRIAVRFVGDKQTKRVTVMVVELRAYAADGTYLLLDDTKFLNTDPGDVVSGIWE